MGAFSEVSSFTNAFLLVLLKTGDVSVDSFSAIRGGREERLQTAPFASRAWFIKTGLERR